MIRFECDYSEGAHPEIIKRLVDTNFEQTCGYSEDEHCENARAIIRKLCDAPDADVHFLVGGTQTNTTVIASVLRPYQGVLSACTGHINRHETGAIESTGHKVLPLESLDGKITAEQVACAVKDHWNDPDHEHIVQPGMVYISQPTENGTRYTLSELTALSETCRSLGLPLFIDGARLGYAMAADEQLTLPALARLCDVFYIGGTKVGALFGEAVVITAQSLKRDFRYCIKQRGGMFAKGRLLGIQFEALLESGLYFDIAKHAVREAMRIRRAFEEKGFPFRYDSDTNQQFPILPYSVLDKLGKKYSFCPWERMDDTHQAVRFCTSWATKTENVDELLRDIAAL